MDGVTLAVFAAAFFGFAASPGPDNLTIVARTIAHGAPAGLAYGAGTVAGILIYLGLAAFGLPVLAAKMGLSMAIIRYAGAAYLVWTGIALWIAAPVVPHPRSARPRRGLGASFATGIALNLSNPKMPLFYVALLPNFAGPAPAPNQVGALAMVIVAVELVVIGLHVGLASRARGLLRTPRIVRRVNRTAGGAMIGAGLAVAAAR